MITRQEDIATQIQLNMATFEQEHAAIKRQYETAIEIHEAIELARKEQAQYLNAFKKLVSDAKENGTEYNMELIEKNINKVNEISDHIDILLAQSKKLLESIQIKRDELLKKQESFLREIKEKTGALGIEEERKPLIFESSNNGHKSPPDIKENKKTKAGWNFLKSQTVKKQNQKKNSEDTKPKQPTRKRRFF